MTSSFLSKTVTFYGLHQASLTAKTDLVSLQGRVKSSITSRLMSVSLNRRKDLKRPRTSNTSTNWSSKTKAKGWTCRIIKAYTETRCRALSHQSQRAWTAIRNRKKEETSRSFWQTYHRMTCQEYRHSKSFLWITSSLARISALYLEDTLLERISTSISLTI